MYLYEGHRIKYLTSVHNYLYFGPLGECIFYFLPQCPAQGLEYSGNLRTTK